MHVNILQALEYVTTFFDGQGFARVSVKVRKTTKIRKRYNQVPHLTQDTIWESNKNTINITNKSQEFSPLPAGNHKAAINRRESIRKKQTKITSDPQKKYHLGRVNKNYFIGGLKPVARLWSIKEMFITPEPHGIVRSKFAYLFLMPLP